MATETTISIGSRIQASEATEGTFPKLAVQIGKVYFIKDLSRKEQEAYFQTVRKVIAGRHFSISGLFDELLVDHELNIGGEEEVRGLKPPFLVISNHPDKAPLDGHWHVQGTNYVMQQIFNQEMAWVFGEGRDRFHPIFERLGLHEYVSSKYVEPIHQRIAECTDSIYVGRQRQRGRTINSVFRQNGIVGLCPEGRESTNLTQADWQSGVVIRGAIKRGLSVLAAGVFKDGKELVINFKNITDVIGERIEQDNNRDLGTEDACQSVADAGMEQIALLIPPTRRGYYNYIS